METTAPAILLDEREARVLSLVGTRLTEWDSGMTARVIVGDSALAVYAVLPMDVMVALAVPAQVDETCHVGRRLGLVRRAPEGAAEEGNEEVEDEDEEYDKVAPQPQRREEGGRG